MPEGWEWDSTLYEGSAPYYARGRLPYPASLAASFAEALALDGRERLLDVGCGPGVVTLILAPHVAEAVGVDTDVDFLAEAKRRARELGVTNARFVQGFGEDVDELGLGQLDIVTFAQSFHWMIRDRAAAATRRVLRRGGAVVHVNAWSVVGRAEPTVALPHPRPPHDRIKGLVQGRLGEVLRAGQGFLRHGTPSGEPAVFAAAGFGPPTEVMVPADDVVIRTADDVVANVFSQSTSAPHLFGADVAAFERELRALLAEVSPGGLFAEQLDDTSLRIYRVA